jgi:hypothetical protein
LTPDTAADCCGRSGVSKYMENKESFDVMDRRPISLLKAAEVSLAENSSGECFVTDGICFTDRGVINGDVSALK